MALGGEGSTRFAFEWTFFAEGKAGENAIRNIFCYSFHYDCFFWPPWLRGKHPLLPE
jgi:hypothetical protein